MDKKNKRSRQTSQPRPASMHCLWTAIDRHLERENTGKTYKDTYGKMHADGSKQQKKQQRQFSEFPKI